MNHRKKKPQLSRKRDPRRALLKNLAESVVLYERVETTEAKAKAVRPYIEKLVTTAKKGDLTARRAIIKSLPTDNAVRKMMDVLGPRYKDRDGGYTRITKIPSRKGDGALMAVIEFV